MRVRALSVAAPAAAVVATEVIAVMILAVLVVCGVGLSWPLIGAVVAVVALAATVRVYRRGAVGWLRWWWRRRRSIAAVSAAIPDSVDVRRGDMVVGVQCGADTATAVVRIAGLPYSPTVLPEPGRSTTANTVPLEVIVEQLNQPGPLVLAGIDIVSAGLRVRRAAGYPPLYSAALKESPAAGKRDTYAVVRLDISASVRGLRLRSTVQDAVAAVAERLVCALAQADCRAQALTADQIVELVDQLGGPILAGTREHARVLESQGRYWCSYLFSPEDISSANLNDVWAWRVDRAVTTVSVHRAPDASVRVSALVRTETPQVPPLAPTPHLSPLHGRQLVAAMACVPGGPRLDPVPDVDLRDVGDLNIPVGPSGILVGTIRDKHGVPRPMLLPLTDPLRGTRIRVVHTDLSVVRAFLLRVAAADNPISIYTDDLRRWAGLTDPLIEVHQSSTATPKHEPVIVVKDREDGRSGATASTILSLPTDRSYPKALKPDIKFTQAGPEHITITTDGFENTIPLATFADERPYLGLTG